MSSSITRHSGVPETSQPQWFHFQSWHLPVFSVEARRVPHLPDQAAYMQHAPCQPSSTGALCAPAVCCCLRSSIGCEWCYAHHSADPCVEVSGGLQGPGSNMQRGRRSIRSGDRARQSAGAALRRQALCNLETRNYLTCLHKFCMLLLYA